jgi:hypothetical protein
MIAAIDNCRAIRLQPVSQRQRRMVQVMSDDSDVVDVEGAFDKIVIANCSSELIRRDGKVSVLHLTGERFAQGLVKTLGTVNVPLVARYEERGEERDPLNVIPVRVTDEDMTRNPLAPLDIKFWPRECAPVPQSMTTSVPRAERTSMHDVFPP